MWNKMGRTQYRWIFENLKKNKNKKTKLGILNMGIRQIT